MEKKSTLQSVIGSFSQFASHAALIAFRSEGREELTYADLADRAERLAWGLAQKGIGAGDHVVLCGENRTAWTICCLAVIQAGAVPVPLDAQLEREILANLLEDCEARLVFVGPEQARRIENSEI